MDTIEIDCRDMDTLAARNKIFVALQKQQSLCVASQNDDVVSPKPRFTIVIKGATAQLIAVVYQGLSMVNMRALPFHTRFSFKEIQPSEDFWLDL